MFSSLRSMRRRMIVRVAVAVPLGSLCKCDFHVLRNRSSRRSSCARVESDRFPRSERRCPPSEKREHRRLLVIVRTAACAENFAHRVIAEFQFVFCFLRWRCVCYYFRRSVRSAYVRVFSPRKQETRTIFMEMMHLFVVPSAETVNIFFYHFQLETSQTHVEWRENLERKTFSGS